MKIYKKNVLCRCLICLLSVMLLCGCGSAARQVDVVKLADDLKSQGSFEDELNDLKTEMFTPLFSIDTSLIANHKSYINSGVTAEAIVVVECKDANGAKTVEQAFKDYVGTNAQMYRSYNPKEADKLDNAVIKVIGDKYVVLCVSGDSGKAKEIIDK